MHKLQASLMAFIFYFLLIPLLATADCECESDTEDRNKTVALRLKLAAIASILVAGGIGVCLPILGKSIQALRPERDIFFIIKAFAAGVILATGMIHVLPDAFENLTSPCLKENPWGKFPFAGFVAMLSAIGTLMVDAFVTAYYKRLHFNEAQLTNDENGVDVERTGEHVGHVHMHTHATHGHAHGLAPTPHDLNSTDLIRHRVISQAKFKVQSMAIMALFFSLTTPVGIAVGIGISSVYDENSPMALIVEGVFNSASAGILIYMALVDLLAADFMNPRIQSNGKLQVWVNVSLLLGAGCMSLMAKWA